MITYNLLYKKIGVMWQQDVFEPEIINATTFVFPYRSVFFYNPITNVTQYITSQEGIFSQMKKGGNKVYIHIAEEYASKTPEGSFQRRESTLRQMIQDQRRTEPLFKIMMNREVPQLSRYDIVIVAYNFLDSGYRYSYHKLVRYYMYRNKLETLFYDLNAFKIEHKDALNRFIWIDLPGDIPSYASMFQLARRYNRNLIARIEDMRMMVYFELFKLLHSSFRTESIFNQIPEEQFVNTNLLFHNRGRVVLINLKVLLSFNKKYKTGYTKIAGGSDDRQSIAIFNLMLQSILDRTAEPLIISDADVKLSEQSKDDEPTTIPETRDAGRRVKAETPEMDLEKYKDRLEKTEDFTINLVAKASTEKDEVDYDDDEEELLKQKEDQDEAALGDDVGFEEEDYQKYNESKDLTELNDNLGYDFKKHQANLESKIEKLRENKEINAGVYKSMKEVLDLHKNKEISYLDNETIEEVMNIRKDINFISQEEMAINDTPIVLDKRDNRNVIAKIDEQYISKQLKKDILRSIYYLEKRDLIVHDYQVDRKYDMMGDIEMHTIQLKKLNGKNMKIKFMMPRVREDGTFEYAGNQYRMRKQKGDNPIVKISPTRVCVSSYYTKFFVDKAKLKKNDLGHWVKNRLVDLAEADPKVKNIILTDKIQNLDVMLPKDYGIFSRYIYKFNIGEMIFQFEYSSRKNLLKDPKELEALESTTTGILVGMDGKTPIIMRDDNTLHKVSNGKLTPMGTLFQVIGVDPADGPREFTTLAVTGGRYLPIGVLLLYYLGVTNLFRVLGIDHEILDMKKPRLEKEQIAFKLDNQTLVINPDKSKDPELTTLLFGFATSQTKMFTGFNFNSLNDKNAIKNLLLRSGFTVRNIVRLDLLESNFIDPITERALIELNLPTSFPGILIKATELLKRDNYHNSQASELYRIKGYERIPGMLYKEIMKSVEQYELTRNFSNATILVDTFNIFNTIRGDNTIVLVDDLNPIAQIKQQEQVTYLGAQGRSKETMSEKTRILHNSEIGLRSEATPDSTDTGVSYYMTAAPQMDSIQGIYKGLESTDDVSWGALISTPGMLAPFADKDDGKRLNYANIQSSHIIPIKEMKLPHVLTGYEAILPIKASNKYVITAEHDGVVLSVTKDKVKVEYSPKPKQDVTVFLFKEDPALEDKEEAPKYYKAIEEAVKSLSYKIVYLDPNKLPKKSEGPKDHDYAIAFSWEPLAALRKKHKTKCKTIVLGKLCDTADANIIKDGDTIALGVEPNENAIRFHMTMTQKHRDDILKALKDVNLTKYTREYSLKEWMSKEVSKGCYKYRMATPLVKGQVFRKDDTIVHETNFFETTFFDKQRVCLKKGTMVNVMLTETNEVHEDAASISQNLYDRIATVNTKVLPIFCKAKDGIADVKNIGDTVQPDEPILTLLDESMTVLDGNFDKETMEFLNEMRKTNIKSKYKGAIANIVVYYNCELSDMSASIRRLAEDSDTRLMEERGYTGRVTLGYSVNGTPITDGEVVIKVYLEKTNGFGIGDKALVGNQLKFIVGDVRKYRMETLDDKEEVDVLFSMNGILNRIVNSAMLMGTTNKVLELIGKKAVSMYFGDKKE